MRAAASVNWLSWLTREASRADRGLGMREGIRIRGPGPQCDFDACRSAVLVGEGEVAHLEGGQAQLLGIVFEVCLVGGVGQQPGGVPRTSVRPAMRSGVRAWAWRGRVGRAVKRPKDWCASIPVRACSGKGADSVTVGVLSPEHAAQLLDGAAAQGEKDAGVGAYMLGDMPGSGRQLRVKVMSPGRAGYR